jgi:hypothetical protein
MKLLLVCDVSFYLFRYMIPFTNVKKKNSTCHIVFRYQWLFLERNSPPATEPQICKSFQEEKLTAFPSNKFLLFVAMLNYSYVIMFL